MGSDLYRGKVLSRRDFTPDWRALTAFVDHPEFDEWCWALGLPDEAAEAVQGWEALSQALSEHITRVGPEAAIAGFSRGLFYNPPLLEAISRGEPEAVETPDDVWYTQTAAVTGAMLAELLPDRFPRLTLAEIALEAATFHPDAGFPDVDPTHWHERSFCLRLLTEADAVEYSESRIYQHFDRHAPDAWAQWDYSGGLDDAMGIVWRAERIRTVDLEVDDPAFWEARGGEWWTPRLKGYLTTPSDNLPYQAVTYRIIAPAGWLRPLTDAVFDSRAY